MSFHKFLQISVGLFFLSIVPSVGYAAILYLEPSVGDYQPGDTFMVNTRIDPKGECVNTIQANLEFSKDSLEVKDVSNGNSIISFWVKEPEFSNEKGTISFAGGIPGGYCGPLLGDPGESNLLGKIIFKVKDSGEQFSATLKFLNSSQVLLNDGMGTPAKLSSRGAVFNIKEVRPPGEVEPQKDEWQEELEKDKIPPEPFEIKINQEPAAFDGKYFIIFSTTDKQSGIDYYEVKEGGKDWKEADSPYLLEDQSLKSIIKVKAVDKARNERIAEYAPLKPLSYWIIAPILIGAWIIWRTIKNLKRKAKNAKQQFKI